jgi:hypothetical protein
MPRCENRYTAPPVSPALDEETQLVDSDVAFWAPAIPQTKEGLEAKHIVEYRGRNGNSSLKKHVLLFHPKENEQVRPPPTWANLEN